MAFHSKKFSILIEGRVVFHDQVAPKRALIEALFGKSWKISKARVDGEFFISVDNRKVSLFEEEE